MRRAAAILLALAAGCGDSASSRSGADEPLRVRGAQFVPGDLVDGPDGPRVLTLDSQSSSVPAGQVGKKIGGDATKGAASVAVRFTDLGSGYWVVPVGPPDPSPDMNGAATWEALCDVSPDAPVGAHQLRLVATDLEGHAGPAYATKLAVTSVIPDGHVVIALTWDANVDLDLRVVTPSGRTVDGKHPSATGPVDGGPPADGSGVTDGDSNAMCVLDGRREESLAWAVAPAPGTYGVWADLFSACGRPSVDFALRVIVDGVEQRRIDGRLLDVDADGGGPGLFLTELNF